MQEIPLRFMGYNRKQVDDYLEKVSKKWEGEILLINDSIQLCNLERDSLLQELDSLREERVKQNKSTDFFDFSLERMKKVIEFIDSSAADDINDIANESKQRLAVHESYLAEVGNEIVKTKLQMESLLYNIINFTQEKVGTRETEDESAAGKVVGTILPSSSKSDSIISALGSSLVNVNEDIVGKMVVCSSGSLVGRVDSIVINQATSGIGGFYVKGGQVAGGRFIPADCIMAVKKDSLVVSAEWNKPAMQAGKADIMEKINMEKLESLKNLIEVQMTADGATAPKVKGQESLTGTPRPAWEGPVRQHAETDSGGSFSGFWGDSGEAGQEEYNPPTEEYTPPPEEFSTRQEGNEEGNETEEKIEEKINEVNIDTGYDSGYDPPPAVAANASPAVAKDIKAVRHRYVVGKLAGEDLKDSGGNIIIHKDGLITPSVVEKAEREGKLADLIINMVIPGLEE